MKQRVLGVLILLTVVFNLSPQAQKAVGNFKSLIVNGASWTVGTTCPPVASPLGAGAFYICTTGAAYSYNGSSWSAVNGVGGATDVSFATGHGLSLAGGGPNPITVLGGSLGGSTSLVIDDATDAYVRVSLPSFTDIVATNSLALLTDAAYTTSYLLITPTEIQINGPIADDSTISSLAAGTAAYGSRTTTVYNATNGSPTTTNLNAHVNDITVGPGAIGVVSNYVGNQQVNGSGSSSNTFSMFHELLEANIGTGFTQTTGPVGGLFFADWQLYGSVAVQPAAMQGLSMLMSNQYNGSPSSASSAGMTFITKKGLGDGSGAHATADTFPIDYAIQIRGYSTASAVDGIGWTTGIGIGGSGSLWGESKSLIGTGVDIQDYATRGIYLHDPTGTPTAAIEATAGAIIFGDLKTTGAATGKKVVCVDTATGKLYASSTGTDCSN